jgi:acyl dehydratase
VTATHTAAIHLHEVPPPLVVGPLTITDFVRYQGASGDLASIHHDYDVAKSAGYDKPFAPGMYPAGLLASWATSWLGPRNIRRFKVRFSNMVWPGDVLTCTGSPTAIVADGEVTTVELTLTCRSESAVVLQGWATFVIPSEEIA